MKVQDLLKERIDKINEEEYEICVLRGFSYEHILYLQSKNYSFLDNNFLKDGLIDISAIDYISLLVDIQRLHNDNVVLLTYESLLALYSCIRNLSDLNKRICILSNNLFSKYINPTIDNIPDYESYDFMNSQENGFYSNYYSNCTHEKDNVFVEYVDINDGNENIDVKPFVIIEDNKLILPEVSDSIPPLPILAIEGDSVDIILQRLFYTECIDSENYLVDIHDNERDDKLRLLISFSKQIDKTIHLYVKRGRKEKEIRKGLYETLQDTFGFQSFRDLKIYSDLTVNRDISIISQGEIIEKVIQQAECSLNKDEGLMNNVLLTAPTGAGKSLLFQLAGIYLAEKYETLTIVISPLVALMEDQVNHLRAIYPGVATLNSNRTPQEKEDILNGIENKSINILYVSPELLLSYSISTFIRGRRIGLMVIDEAHTVTTWGRDFRVDYWFLGSYLKTSKKNLQYNFPIFALTATAVWDPTGLNDMVFETIDSLNMAPCEKYIGVVRREDISFDINNPTPKTNYSQQRIELTADFIRSTIQKNEKAIVYFPYKRDIDRFIDNARLHDLEDKIGSYHAGLNSATRNLNASDFQNGRKIVMMATKAYGMGIDVSDIKTVYHHAPSGSLSDYTQEIGRAARRADIHGVAKIDFLERDLKYAKQLFGLSAIKRSQVRGVLTKLMDLYHQKGRRRNMVVAPEDFSYLFPGDDVDYDQKVKSTLLLISNDLQKKLNYNILIVRPKNIFSKSFISVLEKDVPVFESHMAKYSELLDAANHIYILDCEKLWDDHFSNNTFSQFKYQLGTGTLNNELMPELDRITIINKLSMILSSEHTISSVKDELNQFFNISEAICGEMSRTHSRLQLSKVRSEYFAQKSDLEYERFIETFNLVYCTTEPCCRFYHQQMGEDITHIQLTGDGYQAKRANLIRIYNQCITKNETIRYARPEDNIFNLAQILNSLGLASYERIGGEKPSIFIRINNPIYLNSLVRNIDNYENAILENIYHKFDVSKTLFVHFFTHKMNNNQRWDFIEDYFLGTSVDDLLKYGV